MRLMSQMNHIVLIRIAYSVPVSILFDNVVEQWRWRETRNKRNGLCRKFVTRWRHVPVPENSYCRLFGMRVHVMIVDCNALFGHAWSSWLKQDSLAVGPCLLPPFSILSLITTTDHRCHRARRRTRQRQRPQYPSATWHRIFL